MEWVLVAFAVIVTIFIMNSQEEQTISKPKKKNLEPTGDFALEYIIHYPDWTSEEINEMIALMTQYYKDRNYKLMHRSESMIREFYYKGRIHSVNQTVMSFVKYKKKWYENDGTNGSV